MYNPKTRLYWLNLLDDMSVKVEFDYKIKIISKLYYCLIIENKMQQNAT